MPHLTVNNRRIEYVWYGPQPPEAPTLVLLHEGLGCVAAWRDFPERLAEQTGYGVLVYSREGYGNSDPTDLPRPIRFMHDEALTALPRVLEATETSEAVLLGHSDGGSIALIYAGGTENHSIRGLILEAPHVFVEEPGLDSIRAIAEEYRHGRLKERLERYHGKNVDVVFWGWNQVWLAPAFRSWNIEEYLPRVSVPVLLIQGENDQYGTMSQVKAIEVGCPGSVRTEILAGCGHHPHLDQPKLTLDAITTFLRDEIPDRPSRSKE